MKRTDLAILLATYNGSRYLEEQLDSLRAQTYQDFVCYIHDDGSSDGTQEIIMDYCSKYPQQFVYLGCSPTGGAKYNFMYLLRQVEANYYMFCDQDDVWLPEKIEKTYKRMKEEEGDKITAICVCSDVTCVDENLQCIVPSFLKNTGRDYRRTKLIDLLNRSMTPGCTMMYNSVARHVAMMADVSDTIFIHDWFISVLTAACGKVVCMNEPLMLYRQHSGNAIGFHKKKKLWERHLNVRSWYAHKNSLFQQKEGYADASIICLEKYIEEQQSRRSSSADKGKNLDSLLHNLKILRQFRKQLKQPYLLKQLRYYVWKNF